jgi:hypothetical protein
MKTALRMKKKEARGKWTTRRSRKTNRQNYTREREREREGEREKWGEKRTMGHPRYFMERKRTKSIENLMDHVVRKERGYLLIFVKLVSGKGR